MSTSALEPRSGPRAASGAHQAPGNTILIKDSFPPLLRGIGMLVMLTAAVIAFCIARQHDQSRRTRLPPNQIATARNSGDSLALSVSEIHELRGQVAQDDVIEEVLENVWFECLGFIGTAIFATSFFVEAYLRHKKKT